ncbi:MAG: hypothetical protein AAF447_20250 [Myxococcota bacterium]
MSPAVRAGRYGRARPVRVASTPFAAPAQVVVRRPPPPAPLVARPAARPGHVWVAGVHTWNGYQFVWLPGRWQAARAGHVWVDASWAPCEGGWAFTPGHWAVIAY